MQKKIYFQNLDSIRFIAALMVFFTHTRQACELSIHKPFILKLWDSVLSGGMGVIVFFVLSGFLISYLLLEEQELTTKVNVKNFYMRRVLRIWPLYFLVLLIGFGIYPLINHFSSVANYRLPYFVSFLSNFDLIHLDTHHLHNEPMLDVTWSVSIEEQFYLFWPLLFFLVKPRYYVSIFISTIVASMAWRFYVHSEPYVLWYHTLSLIVDLAIGGLAAYLVIKSNSFKNLFSRIPPIVSLLIYLGGITILFFRDNLMDSFVYGEVCIHLFYGAFFSFVILDQNYSRESFLKLGRYKFLSFWGKYSYGIYLLHPIVIASMMYFVGKMHINNQNIFNFLIFSLVTLVLTLGVSYASYELFEKRFLALKKKFSVIVKE